MRKEKEPKWNNRRDADDETFATELAVEMKLDGVDCLAEAESHGEGKYIAKSFYIWYILTHICGGFS